jgi:hypothetical protein
MKRTTLLAIVIICTCILIGALTSCKSKSGMVSRAKADGRWEQFQNCIDSFPSDAVCEACWDSIIVKLDNK